MTSISFQHHDLCQCTLTANFTVGHARLEKGSYPKSLVYEPVIQKLVVSYGSDMIV